LTLYPAAYGALTQLWAGTTDEGKTLGGKVRFVRSLFFFAFDRANEISQYLIPWARVGKANPIALDPETGKALWTWLEEQVADI
jgi:hypothetical protein